MQRGGGMASAVARAYNDSLGAEPPSGFRGRAPGQGVRGEAPPLKQKAFRQSGAAFWLEYISCFFLYFYHVASESNVGLATACDWKGGPAPWICHECCYDQ